MFCFFFFQAEDGIRDTSVTGVQTCALPICGFYGTAGHRRSPSGKSNDPRLAASRPPAAPQAERRFPPETEGFSPPVSRSEERRVGKECRSRWTEGHVKRTNQRERERDDSQ